MSVGKGLRDFDHYCRGKTICAKAVIVATGVQYRRLPLKDLERFEGAGIYYAATEIEARYCRDTEAIIVGGGNSAGQAAMFLSRAAKHVHLLVRGATLAASMSDYLSNRLEADPGITIHYHSEIAELNGEDYLQSVAVLDMNSGKTETISARSVFFMVGAAPNTDWLSNIVDLDKRGFVKTGEACGEASPYAASFPGIVSWHLCRRRCARRIGKTRRLKRWRRISRHLEGLGICK